MKQKISIIGNGLTGLTAAVILSVLDLEVNLVGGKELKQEENYPSPEQTYEKFSDFKL